jgi:hypothetical protein
LRESDSALIVLAAAAREQIGERAGVGQDLPAAEFRRGSVRLTPSRGLALNDLSAGTHRREGGIRNFGNLANSPETSLREPGFNRVPKTLSEPPRRAFFGSAPSPRGESPSIAWGFSAQVREPLDFQKIERLSSFGRHGKARNGFTETGYAYRLCVASVGSRSWLGGARIAATTTLSRPGPLKKRPVAVILECSRMIASADRRRGDLLQPWWPVPNVHSKSPAQDA